MNIALKDGEHVVAKSFFAAIIGIKPKSKQPVDMNTRTIKQRIHSGNWVEIARKKVNEAPDYTSPPEPRMESPKPAQPSNTKTYPESTVHTVMSPIDKRALVDPDIADEVARGDWKL